MRAKKTIVCVAAEEGVLSERAFVLGTWGYRVLQAEGAAAEELLKNLRAGAVDLVVVFTPMLETEAVLECARRLHPETPSLEVRDARWPSEQPSFADQVISLAGRTRMWADVKERVRMLLAKKRGPKPLHGAGTRFACEEQQRKAVQRVCAIAASADNARRA